jgi:hypothetical protein
MEPQTEIIDLLQKIAESLFPEDFDRATDTQAILLEKIRLRNTELHLAVQDFIFALESMQFVASDYQLRLKAADIWKQQNEMFMGLLQTRAGDLLAEARKNGLQIETEIKNLIS